MGKSRKDYEKFLNSISPDRDDEAWIIGGKNRYCGRENYGTMIKRLTLDLYIQAESFEEAKKLAEAYVQDASLDTTDYPEIVQDVLEVAEYGIIDVE